MDWESINADKTAKVSRLLSFIYEVPVELEDSRYITSPYQLLKLLLVFPLVSYPHGYFLG